MRRAAPTQRPAVLTIAGSDSGGGAGIQADIKTIEAHGCFATSALTAVTAQHTKGVERVDVLEPGAVAAQIEAVLGDIAVDAIKTGMLATAEIVETTAAAVAEAEVPLVVDPVMVAASGDRLLDRDAEAAYDDLLAESTLVTPNADEAEVLTGVAIDGVEAAVEAGEALCARGVDAALLKGGHVVGDPIEDVLVTEERVETFAHERIDTDATHGSGCTLASAIAANLAHGDRLEDAVAAAIAFLGRAIRYHHDVGAGPGAVNHAVERDNEAALAATIEGVHAVLADLAGERAVDRLVPEVGMNVVGALPRAETVQETVAVDGRITRGLDGLMLGDVRLGASGHVARLLLAAREYDASIRFAANCRADDEVFAAIDRLGWPAVEVDRAGEPPEVAAAEGRTMDWVVETAVDAIDGTPVAIYDRGDVGKEAMTRVFAAAPVELAERLTDLALAVEESGG